MTKRSATFLDKEIRDARHAQRKLISLYIGLTIAPIQSYPSAVEQVQSKATMVILKEPASFGG